MTAFNHLAEISITKEDEIHTTEEPESQLSLPQAQGASSKTIQGLFFRLESVSSP